VFLCVALVTIFLYMFRLANPIGCQYDAYQERHKCCGDITLCALAFLTRWPAVYKGRLHASNL